MLRRLLFLSAFLLPFFLTGCNVATEEKFEWTLQSHATSSANDFIELKKFAKNVQLMSGGRLLINVISGDNQPKAVGPDIFTAVSEGRIEMGNGWPNWWSGQHPAWAIMNAGPFDFMNLDASMLFFLAGEGTNLANKLSAPKNIIWRPAWWAGMEFGLLSKTPINSLADLKGKRVRIGPGLPSEVLTEASGALSIPTIPSEIRPALENNDLDAVEWTTTSGAWNLGLQDISPHAIVPAIWQPSVLSDFIINKNAFSNLPDDLSAILESAIKAYTLTTTMNNKLQDFEALKKFKDMGLNISTWSDQDLAHWREVSDTTYTRYKVSNEHSKQIIESKQAFKERFDEYYELFGPYK